MSGSLPKESRSPQWFWSKGKASRTPEPPAGRGLHAASRKPSCNSVNQRGIQLLTRTKVITQSLTGSSAARGKKKISPFCAAVTSSAKPATPPGHKDTRSQETLTLQGWGSSDNHGSSPGKVAQHNLCLYCTRKAPKPSPSEHQEHSYL